MLFFSHFVLLCFVLFNRVLFCFVLFVFWFITCTRGIFVLWKVPSWYYPRKQDKTKLCHGHQCRVQKPSFTDTLSNFKSSESITHRLTKVTRLFLQCQDRSNTHKPSHKHSTLTLNTAIHIVHCSHGTKHEGLIFFERKLSSNLDQSSDTL